LKLHLQRHSYRNASSRNHPSAPVFFGSCVFRRQLAGGGNSPAEITAVADRRYNPQPVIFNGFRRKTGFLSFFGSGGAASGSFGSFFGRTRCRLIDFGVFWSGRRAARRIAEQFFRDGVPRNRLRRIFSWTWRRPDFLEVFWIERGGVRS
jgi:hypothetical protein